MFKKAWGIALVLGWVWAAAPALRVPVPDFAARGLAPKPEVALAFQVALPGAYELVLSRYLDGQRVGEARGTGEGPAVVVAGWRREKDCPLVLVSAYLGAEGAAGGGACAATGKVQAVDLLPLPADALEPGRPFPVAWLSFRDARGRFHQAWWLLSWQGR